MFSHPPGKKTDAEYESWAGEGMRHFQVRHHIAWLLVFLSTGVRSQFPGYTEHGRMINPVATQ